MAAIERVERGRVAYERQQWTEACVHLLAAADDDPLDAEDLQRLATAAYLIGRDDECAEAWTRAHQAFLARGEMPRAARCAFWLALGLMRRGERARGGGWLARARRIVEECGEECVEEGYLLLPAGLERISAGDAAGAYTAFSRAGEIAQRHADPDLVALSHHSRGRVLIRMGEIEKGVTLLDEAMVAVEAGDVSPMAVGDVYCSVIEGCLEIFDLQRAQEWTSVLTHWCESQPDLVPYRGQCLVRRAEIMQLHGDWPNALDEVQQACERLTRPPGEPAAGAAFYQRAELHRLRGQFEEAEEGYRQASRWGKKPQPGLAQLRLAQNELDSAAAAIREALETAQERHARSRLLPAYVEIMLATNDLDAARAGADELSEIAASIHAPFLRAAAAQAQGATRLAERDPRAALNHLRDAWAAWDALGVPYEAARVRGLIGFACRELGDEDGAEFELDAARWALVQLGAGQDLARLEDLSRRDDGRSARGLTRRELEVLRHVAAGETNKTIGAKLFISEKTVARHVSNIFLKLGVSSRAAATAFAYEHQLV